MAKYYGPLGFSVQEETRPGVFKERIVEHSVFGDMEKTRNQTENGGTVNDTIVFNGTLSFIADPFASENYANVKYVTYLNKKWAVKSIDVLPPRIVLNLGGVYNG